MKRSSWSREIGQIATAASLARTLSLRRAAAAMAPRPVRRLALAVDPGAGPPAPAPSLASSDGPLQPPPDIKNIVDNTAQFVARNGPEFEQRILSDNEKKQNPKFAFLQASDPFHAYYVAKVQELGGTTTPRRRRARRPRRRWRRRARGRCRPTRRWRRRRRRRRRA